MSTMRLRINKLTRNGHDELEGDSLEKEFKELIANGYALFVNEVQVHELSEVEQFWRELGEPEEFVEVTAVPALRGGAN